MVFVRDFQRRMRMAKLLSLALKTTKFSQRSYRTDVGDQSGLYSWKMDKLKSRDCSKFKSTTTKMVIFNWCPPKKRKKAWPLRLTNNWHENWYPLWKVANQSINRPFPRTTRPCLKQPSRP